MMKKKARRKAKPTAIIYFFCAIAIECFLFFIIYSQQTAYRIIAPLNTLAVAIITIIVGVADCDGGYKTLCFIALTLLPVVSTVAISLLLITLTKNSSARQNTHQATFNSAKYFDCGETFFCDLITQLEKAKYRIYLEFYIVKDGKIWESIKNILLKKAESGVDVKIIIDAFGGAKMPIKLKKWLKTHKIECVIFNKFSKTPTLFVACRTHRKIAVIDNYVYTGGVNIADEYVNSPSPYGVWKDCAARFEGNIADTFANIILGKNPHYNKDGKHRATIYCDSPFCSSALRGEYISLLSKEDEICFATPYLIPDHTLTESIKNALKHTKTVKIFLPGIPDKKFVYSVSLMYAKQFALLGAQIYLYKPGFLHSKLCLAGNTAIIGSGNIDYRSFYMQYECGVITDCKQIKDAVKKDFLTLETQSERYIFNVETTATQKAKNTVLRVLLKLIAPLL